MKRAVLIAGPVVAIAIAIVLLLSSAGDSGPQARGSGPTAEARRAQAQAVPGTPIVEVVFDELPTATLMDPSGTHVDAKRFPGFARLAASATWYRDNTTVADFTGRAVPAIETGVNPGYDILPLASQQPNSIFSLLGGKYKFNVSEPVTKLCPASLCPANKGAEQAGKGLSAGEFAQDLFKKPNPKDFARFLRRIRPGDRTFNFIHFELPHEPFHFLPDGRSYNHAPISDVGNYNAQLWAGGVGGAAETWQRHYLQTGYADRLIARVIARMKRVGIWSRALLVVTADHGISFDPRTLRRVATEDNFGGVANPPLFIRYPAQNSGVASDADTRSVDVVPTIAQAVGVDLTYPTDGSPISADGSEDGSGTDTVTVFNANKEHISVPLSQLLAEREAVLGRSASQLGSRTGLFQLGPRPNLLGRRARPAGGNAAVLDSGLDLGNVSLARGKKVPAFVNGTIAPRYSGKVIAIGINGRIAATCLSFPFHGAVRWGAVVPPSRLHRGANEVGVYVARGGRLVSVGGT
jgi:Sulfatase